MSYIGNEPVVSATRTITEITATAGQTTFTANGGYTVGYVDVIINGSQLQTADFTATDGSTVVLSVAAGVGDDVRIVAWGTFQTSSALTSLNPSYTGTLTGDTGVVNLGSGQFYKDSSGNVGIGTASPITYGNFVVASSASSTASFVVNGSSTGLAQLHVRGTGAKQSYLWQASASFSPYNSLQPNNAGIYASTNLSYEVDAAGYQSWWTNGNERMRINSSGNVGIGQSNPPSTAKVTIRDASYGLYRAENTAGGFATFGITSDATSRGIINCTNEFLFLTDNTERVRIDSSGNLLIGTTSSNGKLTVVQGAANQTAGYMQSSGVSITLRLNNTDTAGTNHTLLYGTANGGDKIYVLGTGTVSNATGTYNAISDARLKENIVDASSKLEDINQLRVVNYNLIELPEVKQIGFVAQELEQVFPSLIEGFTKPNTDEVYKSVKLSILVPILVKALQELDAKVEAQALEIAALKGTN